MAHVRPLWQVLNRVDLGWNGLGDKGTLAVGDMLSTNSSVTHLDVSHNRINLEGAVALSDGESAADVSLPTGWVVLSRPLPSFPVEHTCLPPTHHSLLPSYHPAFVSP